MSAHLSNATLGPSGTTTVPVTSQPMAYYAPGREALQALLAFSCLHQQIRQRRARQNREGARPDSAEVWRPEQFALDEVLQLVGERVLAITGADGVAIALAEEGEFRCRASAGRIAPDVGARLDPSSGFSGACIRTGLIVRCDDSEKDPRVDREACRLMGLQSMVAVPLMTERGIVGLVSAFCSEPYGFNDSDVRSLSLLAELILAALKPEQDFPELQDSAPAVEAPARAIEPRFIETRVSAPATVEPPVIEPSRFEAPVIERPVRQPAVRERKEPQTWDAEFEQPLPEVAARALPNVEMLRDALTRVTEEIEEVTSEAEKPQEGFPSFTYSQHPFSQSTESTGSRRGIAVAVVLVLLAMALAGGAWWWQKQHLPPTASAPPPAVSNPSEQPADTSPAAAPSESTPTPEAANAAPVAVTGIRHWSSAESTTVAIDLESEVQYEYSHLSNPERTYFDLHDTTPAAGLPGNIEVGDPLLVRIRIAQPRAGVTRVVLETKDEVTPRVSMETNPYRLVVEIRSKAAAAKTHSTVDLFASPSVAGTSVAGTNPRQASVAPLGKWLEPPPASGDAQDLLRASSAKFRIVLDAGHGGWDMGTIGRKGLMEKKLVLDIVARLGKLVSKRLDAEVIYTRHDDSYVSLEKRTEIANLAGADMFLSVHGNYSDLPSARGVETYYTNTYSSIRARSRDGNPGDELNVSWMNVDVREKVLQSRRFAEDVQNSLYRTLKTKNPGTRNRGVREASYVVLTGTTMPAILSEVSFVSSPADENKLESDAYRQEIAEALYKGVATYAESSHRVNMASSTKQ
jgi:N-acetylmuramoyl-L-alanine amidase